MTPELRENLGEIEAAAQHALPKLIELSDIRGDVHAHTTETDGHNSIREMAEAGLARGYQYIAITDHSKNLAMVNGLDEARALEHIRRIREGQSGRSAKESDYQDAPAPFLSAARDLAPYSVSPRTQPASAGFEALEHQLSIDRASPARKARAEEWLRLPITPDVELTVRGPLDAEARARLERCCDLIRNILLG